MITYTVNIFGLREKDMNYMIGLFASIPEVEKVILYGSRAVGNFERGSDIDLAIFGKKIFSRHIAHIHSMLENESPTLLRFDIIHYDALTSIALKKQIDTYGKTVYSL